MQQQQLPKSDISKVRSTLGKLILDNDESSSSSSNHHRMAASSAFPSCTPNIDPSLWSKTYYLPTPQQCPIKACKVNDLASKREILQHLKVSHKSAACSIPPDSISGNIEMSFPISLQSNSPPRRSLMLINFDDDVFLWQMETTSRADGEIQVAITIRLIHSTAMERLARVHSSNNNDSSHDVDQHHHDQKHAASLYKVEMTALSSTTATTSTSSSSSDNQIMTRQVPQEIIEEVEEAAQGEEPFSSSSRSKLHSSRHPVSRKCTPVVWSGLLRGDMGDVVSTAAALAKNTTSWNTINFNSVMDTLPDNESISSSTSSSSSSSTKPLDENEHENELLSPHSHHSHRRSPMIIGEDATHEMLVSMHEALIIMHPTHSCLFIKTPDCGPDEKELKVKISISRLS